MNIEEPPLFMRRAVGREWLRAYGITSYSFRTMLEDTTIKLYHPNGPGSRGLLSREQIRRDVLAKMIEPEGAGCDSSAITLAREVKDKSKKGI